MIVPQFWAEARAVRRRARGQSQIVVRRFGWSDVSQEEAQEVAEARAQDALQRIAAGNHELRRLELKRAYNGAVGVPIREEILQRHGDTIITRNIYGAHCLNTPDVFFADIDFSLEPSRRAFNVWCTIMFLLGVGVGFWRGSFWWGFCGAWLGVMLGLWVAFLIHKAVLKIRPPEDTVRRRLATFMQRRPDWRLRVYRTPAGFRLLATHALFDPASPETESAFSELGVDPVYATMCRNQRCFRARVSPKPWRVGIGRHLKPRAGTWPVKPELHAKRQAWIREYEASAAAFASCRFVTELGSGARNPKAQSVCDLHDRLSQAQSTREIA